MIMDMDLYTMFYEQKVMTPCECRAVARHKWDKITPDTEVVYTRGNRQSYDLSKYGKQYKFGFCLMLAFYDGELDILHVRYAHKYTR